MNVIEQATVLSPTGKEEICAKVIVDDVTVPYVFHGIASAGELYTLSFHVRSESTGSVSVAADVFETERNWKYCVSEFTSNAVDLKLYFKLPGTYYLYKTQLEIGNKATDWTPAPEDTTDDINSVKTIATQTATMFNWLVEGNADDFTSLTLTSTMAELITDSLVIKDSTGSSTIISGGKMDIDKIFAREITATGTIKGVKLEGATGEFTGTITAGKGRIGCYRISEASLQASNTDGEYVGLWPNYISLRALDSRETGRYTSTYIYGGNIGIDYEDKREGDFTSYITPSVIGIGKYNGIDGSPAVIELNGDKGTIFSTGGITAGGDITIDKSENGADTARLVLMNSIREARLFISSSGDIGLYDATNNKYLFTAPANANQLNISLPIQTGGKLTVGGSVYTSKGNGLFCNNQAIARISDVTNYTNCVQLGNSSEDYVVSIYSNGNVWKSGSKTTYFSTTSSSDKRLKNHVRDMDAYEEFFMNLKPVAFSYHDGLYNIQGTQPMIQWGFYAQDTIEAFKKSGLDWKKEEFVVIEDGELSEAELKYVKDGALLKMNYQNISALNTHMTQKNCNDIEELKNKINELENKISTLMASV